MEICISAIFSELPYVQMDMVNCDRLVADSILMMLIMCTTYANTDCILLGFGDYFANFNHTNKFTDRDSVVAASPYQWCSYHFFYFKEICCLNETMSGIARIHKISGKQGRIKMTLKFHLAKAEACELFKHSPQKCRQCIDCVAVCRKTVDLQLFT